MIRLNRINSLYLAMAIIGIGMANRPDGVIAQPQDVDVQAGVQVLTRGPVHEAFAGTITFNPEPGMVVTRAPRDIIEEIPPDERPEGANVTWVPGYWGWDEERSDYLWISGIWRELPPGRQWIPGYWTQTTGGFQWISGYWADASVGETEYLPEPPVSVEIGPNIAAPAANLGWIPGCWIWRQSRYAWRPGYWAAGRPDWDWIPSTYIWAPRGYIYCDGYWDYPVRRRGVLFAPVYFETGVYSRRGFQYAPSIVINLNVFTDHLFLRSNYHHYYFGDYYEASYRRSGYDPFYSLALSRSHYDPFFARERWEHRGDRDWGRRIEKDYNNRRDHVDARPSRLYSMQASLRAGRDGSRQSRVDLASSFSAYVKRTDSPMRYQAVDRTERQRFAQQGQAVQKYRVERQKMDTRTASPSDRTNTKASGPAKAVLPKSTIVGKSVNQLDRKQAPPKRHMTPKDDPKVTPQPRKASIRPGTPAQPPTVKKNEHRPAAPRVQPPARKEEPRPPAPKAPPAVRKPEAKKTEARKPEPSKPESKVKPQAPKQPPAKAEPKKPEPPREPAKAEPKQKKPEPPRESPKGTSKDKPKNDPKKDQGNKPKEPSKP